ncbi:MAG: hypothetical protein ACE5IG_05675 [Dehalococcoidia bacterium]
MNRERIQELLARARALWLPLAAGLFLVVFGAMGAVYFQQTQERNSLQVQVNQLAALASRPQPDLRGLEEEARRIDETLTRPLEVFDVAKLINQIAEQTGVEVPNPPTLAKLTTRSIGQTRYQVLPFNVSVRGPTAELRQFLAMLETQEEMETLMLDKATLNLSQAESTVSVEFSILLRAEQ